MRHAAPFLLLVACQPLTLDAPEPYAKVIFNPSAGEIPFPSDLLRDEATGTLDLPVDGDLTEADRAFRRWLNTRDAFPALLPASATFSDAVDPTTVNADTVQVYRQTDVLVRVDVALALDEAGTTLSIPTPLGGWDAGARYAVVITDGVRTVDGEEVGPDATFWYLRQTTDLTAHPNAFPGDTPAEKADTAAALEHVRQGLTPWFDAIAIPRDDVSVLWTWSVSEDTTVAMDRDTLRVPLPFDLLIDPETELVTLTADPEDTELEADAKLVANTLNGFGVSSDMYFDLTRGVDPATANEDTVQLWKLSDPPEQVPVTVHVLNEEGEAPCQTSPPADDCTHVFLSLPLDQIPLDLGTTYAVVVTRAVTDLAGRPLAAMPLGAYLMLDTELTDGYDSLLTGIDKPTADRLEAARRDLDPLLDELDRTTVAAAWPFTTMDPTGTLEHWANFANDKRLDTAPEVYWRRPPTSLIGDDAISELFPGFANPGELVYVGRTTGIKEIVSGVIRGPNFLDKGTRRWREPYNTQFLPFWAAVPEGLAPNQPAGVVIFGHAIVTDRRFMITVAGELAKRGFVTIAIDFPFHGERIACVEDSLVAIPNFIPPSVQPLIPSNWLGQADFTAPLIRLPPCASGPDATCGPNGECLGPNGQPEDFNNFPIIDMQPASGAAFLDTKDLPHIPDHFHQALVDLSVLMHSIQTEDWDTVLRQDIAPSQVFFAGQSLGSIIGATWVASQRNVDRAVFNVPGSNLVELFRNSIYFKPQIDEYFESLGLEEGSFEQRRLVAVATWLVDSVDPHTVAHRFAERDVEGLIQIARVDDNTGDLIIPNFTTENLARVSGLPMTAYPTVLHADLIVPLIGDAMLDEMADFLERGP